MQIAIASSGRFHVLFLARELLNLGHEVKFYSAVSNSQALRFGLPRQCLKSLTTECLPFLITQKYSPRILKAAREQIYKRWLDRLVSQKLENCDVFIGMSGVFVEAFRQAKGRFGAKTVIERSSKHILAQKNILDTDPRSTGVSQDTVERELAGYDLADRISIPSNTVAQSFEYQPSLRPKLIQNPFGVDLSQFPLAQHGTRNGKETRFLMVGTWCYRKGCDVLVKAVKRLPSAKLLHVGPIGDLGFPSNDPQFQHKPAVPQDQLSAFYSEADAFVLPSREEGLAVVQVQALATGLPLICTFDSGGEDLGHTPNLSGRIVCVPSGNVDALVSGMREVETRMRIGPHFSPLFEVDREQLSWTAYARRYEKNLEMLVSES